MTLCSASHTDSTAVWMASRTACACFGGQVALRQMVLSGNATPSLFPQVIFMGYPCSKIVDVMLDRQSGFARYEFKCKKDERNKYVRSPIMKSECSCVEHEWKYYTFLCSWLDTWIEYCENIRNRWLCYKGKVSALLYAPSGLAFVARPSLLLYEWWHAQSSRLIHWAFKEN